MDIHYTTQNIKWELVYFYRKCILRKVVPLHRYQVSLECTISYITQTCMLITHVYNLLNSY